MGPERQLNIWTCDRQDALGSTYKDPSRCQLSIVLSGSVVSRLAAQLTYTTPRVHWHMRSLQLRAVTLPTVNYGERQR